MARSCIAPVCGSIFTILDEVEANSLLQVIASHLKIFAKGNISAVEMGYDKKMIDNRAVKVTQ